MKRSSHGLPRCFPKAGGAIRSDLFQEVIVFTACDQSLLLEFIRSQPRFSGRERSDRSVIDLRFGAVGVAAINVETLESRVGLPAKEDPPRLHGTRFWRLPFSDPTATRARQD